jgi:hypothetical protein
MRNLTILFLLLTSDVGWCQLRAFDNSKAILPWLYNPSTRLTDHFQAYMGYDGRGSSNFTSQSYVAGVRMPLLLGANDRTSSSVMGIQLMNTSQDLFKFSVVNASFAHQVALSENLKFAFGLGAGIFNVKYDYDDLVYLDQQDPLLTSGESFFSMHLNAGFSLTMHEKFFIDLATPYLIKDHRANLNEIILRVGYILPISADLNLITSANLDTYNNNMIFGGDIRAEWRKMISFLAGADRYKYHGGVLFDVRPICLGYTYGQNYTEVYDHFPAHQISVFGNIPY